MDKDKSDEELFMQNLANSQGDLLKFVASMLVFSVDDVEDVVQDTNVALLEHRAEYDASRPFLTWVFGFARLQVSKRNKNLARERCVFSQETLEKAANLAEAPAEFTPGEQLARLRICRSRLAKRHQRLLSLRYNKRMSVAEISNLLNRTQNSLHVTLHWLRRKLAECIRSLCRMDDASLERAFPDAFSEAVGNAVDGEDTLAPDILSQASANDEKMRELCDQVGLDILLKYDARLRCASSSPRRKLALAASIGVLFCGTGLAFTLLQGKETLPENKNKVVEMKIETNKVVAMALPLLAATVQGGVFETTVTGDAKFSELAWTPECPPRGGGENVELVFRSEAGLMPTLENDLYGTDGKFVFNRIAFTNIYPTIKAGTFKAAGEEPVFECWLGDVAHAAVRHVTVESGLELSNNLVWHGNSTLLLYGDVSGQGKITIDGTLNANVTYGTDIAMYGNNTFSGGVDVLCGHVHFSGANSTGSGNIYATNTAKTCYFNLADGAKANADCAFITDNNSQAWLRYYAGANQIDGKLNVYKSRIANANNQSGTLTLAGGVEYFGSKHDGWLDLRSKINSADIFVFGKPINLPGAVVSTVLGYTTLGVAGNVANEWQLQADGTLRWGADNAISPDATVSCSTRWGRFDLNGHAQTFRAFHGSSTMTFGFVNTSATKGTMELAPLADTYGAFVTVSGIDVRKTGDKTMHVIKPFGVDGTISVQGGMLGLGGRTGSAQSLELNGGTIAGGTIIADTATLTSGTANIGLFAKSIVKTGSGTATLGASPAGCEQSTPYGTVAYYPFDDDAELDAFTVNGTGATIVSGGRHGKCLHLDGTTWLKAPSFPAGVPTGNKSGTIALFFKVENGCGPLGHFIAYGAASNRQARGFRLHNTNGGNALLDYWWATDIPFVPQNGANLRDGKWHSAVLVFSAEDDAAGQTRTRRCYIDGLLAGVFNNGLPNTASDMFHIGAGFIGDTPFKGWLDDITILDRAMTPQDIHSWHGRGARGQLPSETPTVEVREGTLACAPLSHESIVASWRFSGDGTWLKDSGPNGLDLKVKEGTPVYNSLGKRGGSVYFDGKSSLTLADDAKLAELPSGNSPYTVGAWIRKDTATAGTHGWIGWGEKATKQCNCHRFEQNSKYDHYVWGADTLANVPIGVSGDDKLWHFAAATYDGATRKLYFDGVQIASVAMSGLNVKPVDFLIGQTPANNDTHFLGEIGEITVFKRALAVDEIQQLMTSGIDLSVFPENTVLYVAEHSTLSGQRLEQTVAEFGGAGTVDCATLGVTGKIACEGATVNGTLQLAEGVEIAAFGSGIAVSKLVLPANASVNFGTEQPLSGDTVLFRAELLEGSVDGWNVPEVSGGNKATIRAENGAVILRVAPRGTVIYLI